MNVLYYTRLFIELFVLSVIFISALVGLGRELGRSGVVVVSYTTSAAYSLATGSLLATTSSLVEGSAVSGGGAADAPVSEEVDGRQDEPAGQHTDGNLAASVLPAPEASPSPSAAIDSQTKKKAAAKKKKKGKRKGSAEKALQSLSFVSTEYNHFRPSSDGVTDATTSTELGSFYSSGHGTAYSYDSQPIPEGQTTDPPVTAAEVWAWREKVRGMLYHTLSSYMARGGWPYDEVRPLTCAPRRWDGRERGNLDDSLGGYSLTLVDSLSTLAVVGDWPSFRCAASLVIGRVRLDAPVLVSVFETSIRILGGLLSAHLLAADRIQGPYSDGALAAKAELERLVNSTIFNTDNGDKAAGSSDDDNLRRKWEAEEYIASAAAAWCPADCPVACLSDYDGQLLAMAEETALRLLPAFDASWSSTTPGLPFHRINLASGEVDPSSKDTCTAATGTFLLEWGILSQLTGNPLYHDVARRATAAIWSLRSFTTGLVGANLDAGEGGWRGGPQQHTGVGAGVDSFPEYLLKSAIALDDDGLLAASEALSAAISNTMAVAGVHVEVTTGEGRPTGKPPVISALQAFYPGLEVLSGHVAEAKTHSVPLLSLWHKFRRSGGGLPEAYDVASQQTVHFARDSPLRPELIESLSHLASATWYDPAYLRAIAAMVEAIDVQTKVECGFASVADVDSTPALKKPDESEETTEEDGDDDCDEDEDCGCEGSDVSVGAGSEISGSDVPTTAATSSASSASYSCRSAPRKSKPKHYSPLGKEGRPRLDDRLDSYFLSETLQYAFLAFDGAMRKWNAAAAPAPTTPSSSLESVDSCNTAFDSVREACPGVGASLPQLGPRRSPKPPHAQQPQKQQEGPDKIASHKSGDANRAYNLTVTEISSDGSLLDLHPSVSFSAVLKKKEAADAVAVCGHSCKSLPSSVWATVQKCLAESALNPKAHPLAFFKSSAAAAVMSSSPSAQERRRAVAGAHASPVQWCGTASVASSAASGPLDDPRLFSRRRPRRRGVDEDEEEEDTIGFEFRWQSKRARELSTKYAARALSLSSKHLAGESEQQERDCDEEEVIFDHHYSDNRNDESHAGQLAYFRHNGTQHVSPRAAISSSDSQQQDLQMLQLLGGLPTFVWDEGDVVWTTEGHPIPLTHQDLLWAPSKTKNESSSLTTPFDYYRSLPLDRYRRYVRRSACAASSGQVDSLGRMIVTGRETTPSSSSSSSSHSEGFYHSTTDEASVRGPAEHRQYISLPQLRKQRFSQLKNWQGIRKPPASASREDSMWSEKNQQQKQDGTAAKPAPFARVTPPPSRSPSPSPSPSASASAAVGGSTSRQPTKAIRFTTLMPALLRSLVGGHTSSTLGNQQRLTSFTFPFPAAAMITLSTASGGGSGTLPLAAIPSQVVIPSLEPPVEDGALTTTVAASFPLPARRRIDRSLLGKGISDSFAQEHTRYYRPGSGGGGKDLDGAAKDQGFRFILPTACSRWRLEGALPELPPSLADNNSSFVLPSDPFELASAVHPLQAGSRDLLLWNLPPFDACVAPATRDAVAYANGRSATWGQLQQQKILASAANARASAQLQQQQQQLQQGGTQGGRVQLTLMGGPDGQLFLQGQQPPFSIKAAARLFMEKARQLFGGGVNPAVTSGSNNAAVSMGTNGGEVAITLSEEEINRLQQESGEGKGEEDDEDNDETTGEGGVSSSGGQVKKKGDLSQVAFSYKSDVLTGGSTGGGDSSQGGGSASSSALAGSSTGSDAFEIVFKLHGHESSSSSDNAGKIDASPLAAPSGHKSADDEAAQQRLQMQRQEYALWYQRTDQHINQWFFWLLTNPDGAKQLQALSQLRDIHEERIKVLKDGARMVVREAQNLVASMVRNATLAATPQAQTVALAFQAPSMAYSVVQGLAASLRVTHCHVLRVLSAIAKELPSKAQFVNQPPGQQAPPQPQPLDLSMSLLWSGMRDCEVKGLASGWGEEPPSSLLQDPSSTTSSVGFFSPTWRPPPAAEPWSTINNQGAEDADPSGLSAMYQIALASGRRELLDPRNPPITYHPSPWKFLSLTLQAVKARPQPDPALSAALSGSALSLHRLLKMPPSVPTLAGARAAIAARQGVQQKPTASSRYYGLGQEGVISPFARLSPAETSPVPPSVYDSNLVLSRHDAMRLLQQQQPQQQPQQGPNAGPWDSGMPFSTGLLTRASFVEVLPSSTGEDASTTASLSLFSFPGFSVGPWNAVPLFNPLVAGHALNSHLLSTMGEHSSPAPTPSTVGTDGSHPKPRRKERLNMIPYLLGRLIGKDQATAVFVAKLLQHREEHTFLSLPSCSSSPTASSETLHLPHSPSPVGLDCDPQRTTAATSVGLYSLLTALREGQATEMAVRLMANRLALSLQIQNFAFSCTVMDANCAAGVSEWSMTSGPLFQGVKDGGLPFPPNDGRASSDRLKPLVPWLDWNDQPRSGGQEAPPINASETDDDNGTSEEEDDSAGKNFKASSEDDEEEDRARAEGEQQQQGPGSSSSSTNAEKDDKVVESVLAEHAATNGDEAFGPAIALHLRTYRNAHEALASPHLTIGEPSDADAPKEVETEADRTTCVGFGCDGVTSRWLSDTVLFPSLPSPKALARRLKALHAHHNATTTASNDDGLKAVETSLVTQDLSSPSSSFVLTAATAAFASMVTRFGLPLGLPVIADPPTACMASGGAEGGPSKLTLQGLAEARSLGDKIINSYGLHGVRYAGSSTANASSSFNKLPIVAIVLRGHCTFVDKVASAQAAGADAVIVVDASSGGAGSFPTKPSAVSKNQQTGIGYEPFSPLEFTMSGDGSERQNKLHIPAAFVQGAQAETLLRELRIVKTAEPGKQLSLPEIAKLQGPSVAPLQLQHLAITRLATIGLHGFPATRLRLRARTELNVPVLKGIDGSLASSYLLEQLRSRNTGHKPKEEGEELEEAVWRLNRALITEASMDSTYSFFRPQFADSAKYLRIAAAWKIPQSEVASENPTADRDEEQVKPALPFTWIGTFPRTSLPMASDVLRTLFELQTAQPQAQPQQSQSTP
jgi:Glycosyl hydrolase family 47/PA domain